MDYIREGITEYFTRKLLQGTDIVRNKYESTQGFVNWAAAELGEDALLAAMFGGNRAHMERINALLRTWMYHKQNKLPLPPGSSAN